MTNFGKLCKSIIFLLYGVLFKTLLEFGASTIVPGSIIVGDVEVPVCHYHYAVWGDQKYFQLVRKTETVSIIPGSFPRS